MKDDEAAARRALGSVIPAQLDAAEVQERWARAQWAHVVEPGDGVAGALVSALGAAAAWDVATTGDHGAATLAGIDSDAFSAARDRWAPRVGGAVEGLRCAQQAGARLLVPGDADWLGRLDDLGIHAPLALWVRGQLDAVSPSTPTDWHVAELNLAL